jgi:hypothetical protein
MINLLFSYAFIRKNRKMWELLETVDDGVCLMMDSGAFTAYRSGNPIDLDEYMAACKRLHSSLWAYVQLDVIGNHEASRVNLAKMADAGLKPMPVLTVDAPVTDVVEMAKVNNHLCVAGGATEATEWYGPRIEHVWRALDGDCRLHGLGFTRGPVVARTKVASVDSSTYKEGARFGFLVDFDWAKGFRRMRIAKLLKTPFHEMPGWVRKLVVKSGLTETMWGDNKGIYCPLYLLGISTWLAYERFLHSKGIKLFFAVTATAELGPLAMVLRRRRPDGMFDWAGIKQDRPEIPRLLREDYSGFLQYLQEAACQYGN